MPDHPALCRLDDIPDGGAREAHVESATGGFSLVLVRLGDRIHAYHNECPHAGRPLNWAPGRFLIEAGQIVCAAHGAVFGLESGACQGGPCRNQGLRSIAVVVSEGEVRLA